MMHQCSVLLDVIGNTVQFFFTIVQHINGVYLSRWLYENYSFESATSRAERQLTIYVARSVAYLRSHVALIGLQWKTGYQ